MRYNFFVFFWSILRSTWLCIRFPFLYPKNVFSGCHYVNWKLREKYTSIYKKYVDKSGDRIQDYKDKFGDDCISCISGSLCFIKNEYVMRLASFTDRFKYSLYVFIERFLGVFHCIPTYTKLDDMPYGWRKRFGIDFCKELKNAILKSGGRQYMKKFIILDIKEKYGTLRCYTNGETDEVTRVIHKYEYISQYVCIDCGEDAVKCTTTWISPYCEKCIPKTDRWMWIDPIYGWSNIQKEKENEGLDLIDVKY